MKTFLKIAAIAAITALAVISCSPPDVPESHFDWWDEYNEQFDATKYSGNTGGGSFNVNGSLSTSLTAENIVTISLPSSADVLKKDKIAPSDLDFISFNTFNAAASLSVGEADKTLTPITGWTVDRRLGDTIYVKVPISTTITSHVVFKVDGTKYTYRNGLKMDRDGNGVAGEPIYDDYYQQLTVSSPVNSRSYTKPGNRGWTVSLESVPTFSDDTNTVTMTNQSVADASIYGIDTTDRETIIKSLVGGFKIEEFSGGKWSTMPVTVKYDTSYGIYVESVTVKHLNAYRVVFEKGSINLETSKEFYGVKQRIRIEGASDSIYPNNIKNITRLEGEPGTYYNSNERRFANLTSVSDISVYSKDSLNQNVVLKLVLQSPVTGSTSPYTSYYFKRLDTASFKNNFKIYSYDNERVNEGYWVDGYYDDEEGEWVDGYWVDNWVWVDPGLLNAKDALEINIDKVEFKQENLTGTNNSGDNVIYITLDPSYKINYKAKHYYVGDGFGYNDNITVFSGSDIWNNKGFKSYNLGSSTF